jgi:cytochrome c oxidase cbb3-type subunit I
VELLLWNVGLSLGLTVLWAGITSGREYSDFPWFIDLYIAFFMAIPLGLNVWMTIINRGAPRASTRPTGSSPPRPSC